ncbi:hypothetical protein ACE6H2_028570 [Prunus campanulata]
MLAKLGTGALYLLVIQLEGFQLHSGILQITISCHSGPRSSPEGVKLTIKVDQIDWTASQWRDADVLLLNAGHKRT